MHSIQMMSMGFSSVFMLITIIIIYYTQSVYLRVISKSKCHNSSKHLQTGSLPGKLPYFFTYKPSDFFSIWHRNLRDFSSETGSAYSWGFGIKKKLLNSVVLLFLDNTSLFEGL